MSIKVGYNPYFTCAIKPERLQESRSDAKSQLSKVLFGKHLPATSAISFGWSAHISEIEGKILDVLTDPANKNVIVAAHSYPDGDAYGSNIGMAGILESLGKSVHSIIEYRPKLTFQYMPSPRKGVMATEYIKQSDSLNGLKKADVAIFVDTGEPNLLKEDKSSRQNAALEAIIEKNPHTVVIIDHHPDQPGEPPNEQIWLNEFKKRGFNPKKVLYWCEKRAAAAEMVSELDQELVAESQKRPIKNYNPNFNHNYRLGPAVGIMTDAYGTVPDGGTIDDLKFQRLSYDKAPGTKTSTTRSDFNWLINNCDIKKSDIDTDKLISRIPIDPAILKKLDRVMNKEETLKGVEIKLPSKGDPLGYVYIKDWKSLDYLARQDKNGKENHITAKHIYKIIKSKMMDRLLTDNNAGTFVLANKGRGEEVFLTLRSYGYDNAAGEIHKPGHVFGDALAMKINQKLEPRYGSGGGHKNAVGYKSHKGVDFHRDLLPEIKKVVKEYVNTHGDLTKIPKDKLEMLKSMAFVDSIGSSED